MKLITTSYTTQFFIGLLFTGLVFAVQFSSNPLVSNALNRFDGILYDFRLQYLPPWPQSQTNIQIVDIDEASLHEFGRMPWPRKQFAALTTQLTQLGAITIAFDVLFTEPEINPASIVANAITDVNTQKRIQAISADLDGDLIFSQTMQNNEIVLATLFHQQQDINKGQLFASTLAITADNVNNQLYEFSGFSANTPLLAKHATSQGFVNAIADPDGFIRRSPLVIQHGKFIYPSLALAAFQSYTLADNLELVWQHQQQHSFLSAVQIGKTIIATDNKGQLLLPFRKHAYYYPYTAAADVLDNRIKDQRFDGAVVFVGSSATGLADLRTTPVGLNFPGVEIHATIFDALMSPQSQPYRPHWWQGAIALTLFVIGLLLSYLLPRLEPGAAELLALAVLITVITVNFLLWYQFSIDLPLTSSLTLVIALSLYYMAYGLLRENKRRQQVKSIFGQYVPAAHIDEILASQESIKLDGERKCLTVLFGDIRNFTTISESLTPKQLSQWLNQFFTPITKDIFDHQGTIDKYVGDMVMAFWGAPLPDEQHALNAIKTAFAMLDTVHRLAQDFTAEQLPVAKLGIGINTGEMNIGDMGSQYRLSYTVLGDAVNLGSRLEGLTKFYHVNILIGETSKQQAERDIHNNQPEIAFILIDKVNVKGKQQPVTIYTPIPLPNSAQLAQCQQFNQMMEYYFQQEFMLALASLDQIYDDFEYTELLILYRQRITQLLAHPPAADWNGAFVHRTK